MASEDVYGRDDDELDLRVYLSLLRRRWLVIAVTMVVVVVVALAFTVAEESKYRASSEILIRQTSSALPDIGSPNVQQAERALNNEERLFRSASMRQRVDEAYDGPIPVDRVRASTSSGTSDVLEASVTDSDPDEAVALLTVYVDTFIDYRRAQELDDLLAVSQPLEIQIQELTESINELRQPIAAVDAQLATNPDSTTLLNERAELEEQLADTITPLVRQRAALEAQLDRIDMSRQLTEIGGATVLSRAEASSGPVSPQPVRNLALAGVIGLILGVGLAFARDSLDTRIHNIGELEDLTGGLPTLAVIPAHSQRKDHNYVATRDQPTSTHAEAYRSLRTSIRFSSIEKPMRVLQVTSAKQGEGKSTTVANLAVAFAKAGERVLVICCDLRRPHIQDRFGLDLTPGFTDVVVDGKQPADVIKYTKRPKIAVITAGPHLPNPSELLSLERAKTLIRNGVGTYDVVIVDTPPVLPVTDAVIVSQIVDATLVVVDARSTKRDDVAEMMRRLDQANAPVLGTVLNGVPEGARGYGYGYGYGYGAEPADEPRSRRRGGKKAAKAEAEAERTERRRSVPPLIVPSPSPTLERPAWPVSPSDEPAPQERPPDHDRQGPDATGRDTPDPNVPAGIDRERGEQATSGGG